MMLLQPLADREFQAGKVLQLKPEAKRLGRVLSLWFQEMT